MTFNLESIARWLTDPFNRRDISKHDEIVEVIQQTRERSNELLAPHYRGNFPIAATIGNPRLRGRAHYARH